MQGIQHCYAIAALRLVAKAQPEARSTVYPDFAFGGKSFTKVKFLCFQRVLRPQHRQASGRIFYDFDGVRFLCILDKSSQCIEVGLADNIVEIPEYRVAGISHVVYGFESEPLLLQSHDNLPKSTYTYQFGVEDATFTKYTSFVLRVKTFDAC
jgi:hypothetical protein